MARCVSLKVGAVLRLVSLVLFMLLLVLLVLLMLLLLLLVPLVRDSVLLPAAAAELVPMGVSRSSTQSPSAAVAL
jgi:hypothetical protein